MKIFAFLCLMHSAMAAWFSANFAAINDPTMPNALVKGKVYMRWDSAGSSNNRMLTEFTSPGNLKELVHQGKQIRYRYCNNGGNCQAETYKVKVQPPVKSGYSCSGSATINGVSCTKCTKSTSNDEEVKEAYFNGNTLVRWVFRNGRIWDFSGQSTAAHGANMEPSSSCPAPRCTRMIDLLINLDDSGSISSSEWKTLTSYVNTIIGKFEVANDATMVGITFFTNTGRVIRSLTGDANAAKNAVKNASRKWGNTCVGAGIRVGFNNILNKASASRKAFNPKKIVISITDGVDSQCSSTNTASAVMKSFKNQATFIAVGVGNGVTKSNLQKVATSGSYVITSGKFSELSNTVNSLVGTTCQDLPAMNPCGKNCKGFCNCNKQCVCPPCYQPTYCTVVSCSSGTNGCVKSARVCTNSNKCKKNEGCAENKKGCWLSDVPEPAVSKNDECKIGSCAPSTGWTYTVRVCPTPADPVCNLTRCRPNKKGGCDYYPRNCDDGNWCTNDTCRPHYGCVNTPVVCDDKNACTDDYCDKNDMGKCKSKEFNITERCNDNNACTHEHCDTKTGCYHTPVDCRKNEPCKIFKCDTKTGCYSIDIPGCGECDITCDDSNKCKPQYAMKVDGECKCVEHPVECDDGNPCTIDSCDTETGNCKYEAVPAVPIDACHTAKCDTTTGNVIQTPIECEYQNACKTGQCKVDADSALGYVCEFKDVCEEKPCHVVTCNADAAAGAEDLCQYEEIMCDQIDPCSNHFCDPELGACVLEPMLEPPAALNLVANKCQTIKCSPEKGWYLEDIICENDDPCKVVTCNLENGQCEAADPCNDGDWCTDDSCSSVSYPEKPENAKGIWSHTYVPEESGNGMILTHHEVTCQFVPKLPPTGFLGDAESCFEAVCNNETTSWSKKVLDEAFTDPCGACVSDYDQYYEGGNNEGCIAGITKNEFATALGGAAIAGVIVAAVIGAAVVAISGVFGTKELISRSAMAAGQSVQNNPFYKENANEMVNPTFEGNDGFNY